MSSKGYERRPHRRAKAEVYGQRDGFPFLSRDHTNLESETLCSLRYFKFAFFRSTGVTVHLPKIESPARLPKSAVRRNGTRTIRLLRNFSAPLSSENIVSFLILFCLPIFFFSLIWCSRSPCKSGRPTTASARCATLHLGIFTSTINAKRFRSSRRNEVS